MAYTNLPQILEERLDGNLITAVESADPVTLVIGTAGQGPSETVYPVERPSDANSAFGGEGTLTRGMFEVNTAGAERIYLYRIGATAARLDYVGGGITIETIQKDDEAGADYELFWDHSAGRLRVWRTSDGELVYDNNPSYPSQAVDEGEVSVTGSATSLGTETDIGSLASPVTLAAADGLGGTPAAVYTAGTDGLNLSRMETYEALYNAYEDLEDQAVDIIVPMNVFLDDENIMDKTEATASGLAPTGNSYPTVGETDDVLGKLYVEEYDGENYFWWWFPTQPNADADTDFAAGSGAQIYPAGVGLADATHTPDGTELAGSDFHEVNFAYQLANFCYNQSSDIVEMTGVIGVKPPVSYAPREVSRWVGKLPTTEINVNTGVEVININGSGLLGNKFMVGRNGSAAASGIPGLIIDGVDGRYGGGFIATDSGFLDGTQQKDDNDALIDIGQFISVVSAYPVLANSSATSAYVATGAPSYGGFYSALPANSSPANKVLPFVQLPFRLKIAKVDTLAGAGYVMFHSKPKGIVISDAPTASRAESDYRRLTTVRIVKAVVDDIRAVADPFIGGEGGLSDLRLAALESKIGDRLQQRVKDLFLIRYDKSLSSTPIQRVLGQAVLELVLVPAFEFRKLTVVVSLAAI